MKLRNLAFALLLLCGEAAFAAIENIARQTSATAVLTEVASSQLTTFFTTAACTALKSPYAGMSDGSLRAAMSALPAVVRDMAVNVKNNVWAAAGNGTDVVAAREGTSSRTN